MEWKRGEKLPSILFHLNSLSKGIIKVPLADYKLPRELQAAGKYVRVPASWKKTLQQGLTLRNHKEKFHALLYVEEMQQEVDIRRYDMRNAEMTKENHNQLGLKVGYKGAINELQSLHGPFFKTILWDLLPFSEKKSFIFIFRQKCPENCYSTDTLILGYANLRLTHGFVSGSLGDLSGTQGR